MWCMTNLWSPLISLAERAHGPLSEAHEAVAIHPGALWFHGAVPVPPHAEVTAWCVRWTVDAVEHVLRAVPESDDVPEALLPDLRALALELLKGPHAVLRWNLAYECVEIGMHGHLGHAVAQVAPMDAAISRTPTNYCATWRVSDRAIVRAYVTDPSALKEHA